MIRLLPRDRGLLDIAKLGLLAARRAKSAGDCSTCRMGWSSSPDRPAAARRRRWRRCSRRSITPFRKILTIEDPIEYEMPGINQSQVKPEIGLTFAAAMRAFVRQDPDVIMVGEVRDAETANIAVHAALTGHLVLTTLHTETSRRPRCRGCIDLGVEAFSAEIDAARGHRPAAGARAVRPLQNAAEPDRRRSGRGPAPFALGFKLGETVSAQGLRALRRRRLSRPGRRIRGARGHGRDARADRAERRSRRARRRGARRA